MNEELRRAIIATSRNIGINPLDLATAMSYETGGTFDPWKKGPTTKWGTHRGLIQWGEPQAKQYGVYKGMPVADQVSAAGRYLQDRGVKPGMGLLDVYSAINAGGVGEKFYGRSDTAAGGAPGTVRDKVEQQMSGHKAKAQALLGALAPQLDQDQLDFVKNNPQPGGFGPGIPDPNAPMAPPIAGAPMQGGQPDTGIPSFVADFATAQDGGGIGGRLGAFFSALGEAANVKAPRPPAHPGGPSPQQANAVLNFLSSPNAAESLLKKRLAFLG